MTRSPVSITIPADATMDLRHATTANLRIPVSDSGTLPLAVTMHTETVTRLARQYPAASWAKTITPARLTLKPGQTGYFTLHVVVPHGVQGTHYLNFVAQSAPTGHGGLGQLGAGVGGTLTLLRPGFIKALPLHAPPRFVPPMTVPSFPWTLLFVAVLVAVVALGLGVRGLRRRHRAHA